MSAFVAIVGPVLLIEAQTQGAAFAARAAAGTLLGLAALSGFAVAYAHAARLAGWRTSLVAGWAVAAIVAAAVVASGASPLAGPPVAALSLTLAYRAMPRGGPDLEPRLAPRSRRLACRRCSRACRGPAPHCGHLDRPAYSSSEISAPARVKYVETEDVTVPRWRR